ncbi:class 3-domain-containing protein [Parasitella parasitica]|nr:class 3-domain-containing protein [Parasitella parasitica]
MSSKGKQLVMEITIAVAFLVALFGYYLNYKGRWILSLLCYLTSVFILSVPLVMYISFKTIQYFMPFITSSLTRINQRLMPIANYLSHHQILGSLIGIFIKSQFFMWFMVLLMSDQAIRIAMGRFAGLHASNQYLSLINVGNSQFFKSIHQELDESSTNDQKGHEHRFANYGESNPDFKQPHYSLSVAHSLSVASKLAYEDVAVVHYELEKAGYDVQHTFKALGYKNVCAFAVEKDNAVLLVFRGTNPLNIQNYVTNVDAGLAQVSSLKCYMGKVHRGFWDAMGASEISDSQRSSREQSFESDIHVNLSSASLYQLLATSILGIMRIIRTLSINIFANVLDPIDASWVRHSSAATIRYQSMYTQSEEFILELFKDPTAMDVGKKKKFYITGHSLGGALATVFLAKMIQKESPLLEHFEGLYTYGQPNIGDQDFSRAFTPDITCKIFNHVYNNDIVPRIPYWYSPPPGTLVFIDSSYKMCLYPPNQKTQEPIPLRSISYLHLSGLLNKHVILRLRSETTIRILFRILLPFFINDHFPSDYSDALFSASIKCVILGQNEAGYDEEDEQTKTFPSSIRYKLQIAQEEESH